MSCQKDGSLNSADRNVVSEEESTQFEELLILVSIKTTDSTYLVVESIDSVNIFVNDFYWANVSSDPINTANVDKFTVGNMTVTTDKLNYLIVAEQEIEDPDFTVAGDFAEYLNSFYDLDAGEYACFIESFQVTFNDNSTKKYYPLTYEIFKVEENTRSAFVGEFEIKID